MSDLNITRNHSLQALNTLAVPSVAGVYLRVSDSAELKQALLFARERNLKVLTLGGGSNVILPERIDGLVIHIAIKGITVVAEDRNHVCLCVGAGEVWQDLVSYCLDRGYCGLENLSLIPGTVGAAPIQNIGAYGVELDSIFAELNAVDRHSGADVVFDRDACHFSYRDSVFKNRLKDRYIISSVTLRLSKEPYLNLSYAPLQEALENIPLEQITPQLVSQTVCDIRRGKLPDPGELPNAGSFFKNPIVSQQQFYQLQQQYPDIVSYPADQSRIKIAAAWLLEKSGWRGHSERGLGLGMHVGQALVLVNPGRCRAGEILDYAARIQADVQTRFGIGLELEPVVYSDREQVNGEW